MSAEIRQSALIVVDMQNDFLHADGALARRIRENPAAPIDMEFLRGAIAPVGRLVDAFRGAGRPVLYLAHVLRPDYADAQFPYWRIRAAGPENKFLIEGSFGARIVDELTPRAGELIVKKGYDGFSNTPLDTMLRTLRVTTCVVAGVMTSVCVSSTVRSGVERNYRMMVVGDASADTSRDNHAAELKILGRAFADIATTDAVLGMLR